MKMTELKMYEAPKMEIVEVEMENMLAASPGDTNADNGTVDGMQDPDPSDNW